MQTERLTQRLALVDVIVPASRTSASDVNGEAIDGSRYHTLLAELFTGAIGSSGTAQVVFQHSDVSGSGFADISGAAGTALVDTEDGGVSRLELQLWRNPAVKRYIRAVYRQVGTNAILGCISVHGVAYSQPSSKYNDSGDDGAVLNTVVK